MALGDYILCCKCEVKLIYDGDRGQREWWGERFGKPPEIECPDCKAPASKPWVGLTQQDIDIAFDDTQEGGGFDEFARAIEAKLREKNAQPSKPLTDEQRKAIVVCFTSGKVSVSEVQRKLAISYNEAQQLCQSIVDLGLAQGLQLAPSLDRHGIKGDA